MGENYQWSNGVSGLREAGKRKRTMLEARVLFRKYVVAEVCNTLYTRQERYAACETLLEASLYYGRNYRKTRRKVQLDEARVKIYKSWKKGSSIRNRLSAVLRNRCPF